jgi:hypothetical protein
MKDSVKQIVTKSRTYHNEIDLDFVKKDNLGRLFLYFIDIILLALVFFYFSLGGSSFINAFICQQLNTSKSKLELFAETSWESFTIILLIFTLLFYIPRIPCIVPFPDANHMRFREIGKHVITAAATVFAHERLLNKYQFLLGVDQS